MVQYKCFSAILLVDINVTSDFNLLFEGFIVGFQVIWDGKLFKRLGAITLSESIAPVSRWKKNGRRDIVTSQLKTDQLIFANKVHNPL